MQSKTTSITTIKQEVRLQEWSAQIEAQQHSRRHSKFAGFRCLVKKRKHLRRKKKTSLFPNTNARKNVLMMNR